MNASFYDLLKYAATGIASPGMTYYDKMRALAMTGGGTIKTLTGIPPLSFKSNGKPLISWSMLGNGQQTGTPTPDAPIQPEFVGVRTGNLAKYWKAAYVTASGEVKPNRVNGMSFPVKIEAGQTVIFANQETNFGRGMAVFSGFDGVTLTDMIYRSAANTVTYTANSDCYVVIWGNYDNATSMDESVFALCGQMLNLGSTALPYEPYGYKIPITNAGQTVPVYLGQTPTVRKIRKWVLDGTEEWNVTSGKFYLDSINPDYMRAAGKVTHMCSHFPASKQASNVTYVETNTFAFGSSIYSQRAYCTYTGVSTAADFKSYLAAQYAAGTPVTVWYVLATPETDIVNEPLAKIGDYADELHSIDAGVSIPTANGDNTLTVGTELQPSSMTITGHIE